MTSFSSFLVRKNNLGQYSLNPFALRKINIVHNVGLSECKMVNSSQIKVSALKKNIVLKFLVKVLKGLSVINACMNSFDGWTDVSTIVALMRPAQSC